MALLIVLRRLKRPVVFNPKLLQVANISAQERQKIGNREIVGYGMNGQPSYMDWEPFPCPAIRFKETTPELEALREKEKGDWHQLTCEEKKALYRWSYCQTYAEFANPRPGAWKMCLGMVLMLFGFAIWPWFFFKVTIYNKPLPETFDEERRACQFRRYLDLQANPIEGLASKWDYEKDDWKDPNDPWRTKPPKDSGEPKEAKE